METLPRLIDLPSSSFFLFGPRGTGKTTWLRDVLSEALSVNLLHPEVYRELSARPERLRELVLGNPNQRNVIIDEVQRVPDLLPVVHDLMEQQPAPRFVLTGSSARKLRRGGTDLLGGRAIVREMHPFMAAELPDFELDRALQYGLVPLVVAAADPAAVLAAYATLYLEQEVQFEGLVRNIGSFARFLEAASFSHGGILNVSNVARESQTNRKTVEGYVAILEDLLLAFRVPAFTRRAVRQTTVQPKFFYFDAGVFRSLRPRGPLDRVEEIAGPALEGLIAQHLRAWIAYTNADYRLHYWRTRAGLEVDFVVYGESGFWAIEVKNTRTVRSLDVRALRAFRDDYPECTPLLVYRGRERLNIQGVLVVPVDEFLKQLHPRRGLIAGV